MIETYVLSMCVAFLLARYIVATVATWTRIKKHHLAMCQFIDSICKEINDVARDIFTTSKELNMAIMKSASVHEDSSKQVQQAVDNS